MQEIKINGYISVEVTNNGVKIMDSQHGTIGLSMASMEKIAIALLEEREKANE